MSPPNETFQAHLTPTGLGLISLIWHTHCDCTVISCLQLNLYKHHNNKLCFTITDRCLSNLWRWSLFSVTHLYSTLYVVVNVSPLTGRLCCVFAGRENGAQKKKRRHQQNPYIMPAPCGCESRLGIWQSLNHVLLRLLFVCVCATMCTNGGAGESVQTNGREISQNIKLVAERDSRTVKPGQKRDAKTQSGLDTCQRTLHEGRILWSYLAPKGWG